MTSKITEKEEYYHVKVLTSKNTNKEEYWQVIL